MQGVPETEDNGDGEDEDPVNERGKDKKEGKKDDVKGGIILHTDICLTYIWESTLLAASLLKSKVQTVRIISLSFIL